MHKGKLAAAVLGVVTGAYACGDRDITGPNLIPAAMEIVSGQEQSGRVAEELAEPLVARVLNSVGQPVAGQIVNFRVLKGDGSVFAGAAITNADGLAQERWTLGKSVADSQVVEARAVDPSSGAPLVFARFVATALAGAPATVEETAGDAQTATAGNALPDSILIRLLDAYGNPVPDAPVSWSVESGGGTVARATDRATATGYSSNKWTLGSAVGAQVLRAIVRPDLYTTFTANSVSAADLRLIVQCCDGQTATPGSRVALPPTVRVVDGNGPRSGVPVTFAVTRGGGTITGQNAVSGSLGSAEVGSWTLGNQPGINNLTATLQNGASLTFTATGALASPDITASIEEPSANLVSDQVAIRVSVASRLQLAGVQASLAGRLVTLTASANGRWTGTISLVGAPRDTMTLVVTATDANGTVAQAVRGLIHDRPPTPMLAKPVRDAVARPSLDVDATCVDDDPTGCTLSIRTVDGTLLAGPSPSPLRTNISLAAFDGQVVTLVVEAKDSKEQRTIQPCCDIWVESSSHLQLFGTGGAIVIDASDSRLLWSNPFTGITHLGGVNDTISGVSDLYRGYLTPTGAVFSGSLPGIAPAGLYQWQNGVLTTKAINSNSSLAAAGNYIIYGGPGGGYGPLYRTDVTSGEEVRIATNAGNTDNSVAENGDVAYWNSSYDIVRYRAGISTPVTSDDDTQYWNTYPLTDGTNIVFRHHTPCCAGSRMAIWLFDGTSLSELAPATRSEISPLQDYAVNGGWTAFTKTDASLRAQVWTRSPSGVLRAVSALATSSTIRGVGSDGSVIFDNGGDRYFATSTGAPGRIASSLGQVVWRDGRFLILVGNSAFTVVP